MTQAEILTGGNSNQVVKEGETVVRRTGAWSPFVHALLRHLTAAGFTESPVLLASGDGQERLSFIGGEVGNYPLKPYMQTDEMVVEAAKLLRRYHDLTQNFVIPADANFMLPLDSGTPREVICHNDFAPYNCVFRDGHLAGIIDFDAAAPGSRVWDIAYAVYRFAPLTNDAHTRDCGWEGIPDRAARLKIFCDSYGLEDRAALIPTVIRRLESLVDYMRRTSSNPEHIPLYLNDIDYIREHEGGFTGAL
jgi:thiamine kinase-like enzyme